MATSVEDKSSNFLRQFRDLKTREFKLLSAQQFMEVWNHYDTDGKGFKNFSFFIFPVDTILSDSLVSWSTFQCRQWVYRGKRTRQFSHSTGDEY